MKNIIQVSLLLIPIFFNSCHRDGEASNNEKKTFIDNYTLEMDNKYVVYKVSLSSYDSRNNFIIEYIYSQGSIQKTLTYSGEPGERVTVYHINNSGLADTSLYWFYYNGERSSSSTSYFLYDSNNYLKMKIYKRTDYANLKPDTTFYYYNTGNIIKIIYGGGMFGIIFPTSSTYTYNSISNFVDIESFNGAFIGKLNQNLIESVCDYGSPEGTYCRRYQYILNSNGLVKERTKTPSSGQVSEILVDKFEYIIK